MSRRVISEQSMGGECGMNFSGGLGGLGETETSCTDEGGLETGD